jgi:predicted RND superfamily exporter protein
MASLAMSVFAILCVILIITASVVVTLLVAFSVALVDLYLLALFYYWEMKYNHIVFLLVIISLGLSVDYSAHIAHCYLTIRTPESCKTDAEKRKYKVEKALGQIGSSIFHGGASTFLAVITLSPSKFYAFVVFFRSLLGIVLFGMANGFVLLPVLLSYIGPTENVGASEDDDIFDCAFCIDNKVAASTDSDAESDSTPESVPSRDKASSKASTQDP